MQPINYIEKGFGLHEAFRSAGINVVEQNGDWLADDPVSAQALIDGYTLAKAIAYRQAASLAIAKTLRDKAVAGISAGEMAGWPIKRAEAIAFMADPVNAATPMLSAEAAARGISVAALVAKVGGNSARFGALEAAISGADGAHRDALASLQTFEAIAAYDLTAGWPEV